MMHKELTKLGTQIEEHSCEVEQNMKALKFWLLGYSDSLEELREIDDKQMRVWALDNQLTNRADGCEATLWMIYNSFEKTAKELSNIIGHLYSIRREIETADKKETSANDADPIPAAGSGRDQ